MVVSLWTTFVTHPVLDHFYALVKMAKWIEIIPGAQQATVDSYYACYKEIRLSATRTE